MRKIVLEIILFMLLISSNLFAISVEKAFSISQSSNYGFSDYDTGDVGVVRTNGIVVGRYINPIYDLSEKHLSVKRYILYKGLMNSVDILREDSNANFKIILGTRKDIMDTIDKLDIAKKVADRLVYTTADKFAKDYFDTMLDIYTAECKNASKDNLICNIVKSPVFGFVKDIGFAYWDEYFDKYRTVVLKKAAIRGAVEAVGVVMFTADTTLKVSKIVTNFTSAWAIEKNVIEKSDISLMLMDFHTAYQYFNMDIEKLSQFLVEKSLKYNYKFDSLNPEKDHLKTFLDVFFHYIHLRKVTNFGIYNFELGREIKGRSSIVENVDMHTAPKAAQLMLNIIEEYGNGGNLKINISPNTKYGEAYIYGFEKANPLYSIPTNIDNVFSNKLSYTKIEYYKAFLNSPVHYDADVKATCGYVNLLYQGGISSTGKIPIISSIASKYNVIYKGGNKENLFLHKFNLKIVCKYTADQIGFDTSWSNSIILKDIFMPEKLSDIRGKFAEKHIRKLYGGKYIIGYNDGLFKGSRKISNGEFLKIASRAILKYTDETKDDKGNLFTDDINKPFSKYIKFLKNENKDIELLDGKDIINNLNNNASRGYVAKVLSNILKSKDKQLSKCENIDDEDWDECSDYLRDNCISVGSEKEKDSKTFIYKPNIDIRRDEISKLIVNSMKVSSDGSLCSKKKEGS
ncbi:MAG TPA: S-layer homology domain-containing protein [Archaeoglobus profundus]|nr:S-layer homology domain-containing protein [Archaeoglobus profundus]